MTGHSRLGNGIDRAILRLLHWSSHSRRRWLILIAGLVLIPGTVGLLLGRLGPVAVIVGCLITLALVIWTIATLPPLHYQRSGRYMWTERQFSPANGPAPCALCGYNCIPGGFWSPVPGHLNKVMHTMGCPTEPGPGEEYLAEPTLVRDPNGRYVPLGTS